ncbi:hypothetical protein ACFLWB_02130 [Chloroflexota bacterium]
MKSLYMPACNRVASHVDLETVNDALYIQTCHWLQYAREIYKEVQSMRKLITVAQFIEDLKADGIETDQVYLDPEDALQIPETEED